MHIGINKKHPELAEGCFLWSGIMAGVRTFWQDKRNWFYMPSLTLETAKIN